MGLLFFKAIDNNNNEIIGEIEASSNKEALQKIEEQGLRDIELLNDVTFPNGADELKDLNKKSRLKVAKLDAISLKKPTLLNSFTRFLITNKIDLTLSLLFVLAGLFFSIKSLIVIGLIWFMFRIGLWIYSYKATTLYEQINKEFIFGNWAKMIGLSNKLLKMVNNPMLESDLKHKKAQASACKGHLDYALSITEEDRDYIQEQALGVYNNRRASIYFYARDYTSSLNELEESYKVNPSSITALDLALFNARVGDINYARDVLHNRVNIKEVPIYGNIFYYMIKGKIAYSLKDFNSAKIEYENMMREVDKFIENPLLWEGISIAIAYYTLLLYDIGKKQEGINFLKPGTVQIINTHADDYLRAQLHERYPDLINKESRCKKSLSKHA